MKQLIVILMLLSFTGCAHVLRDEDRLKPAPSIHPALANGCACKQKPEVAMMMQTPMRLFNIEAVYFDTDKADLLPSAEPKLLEIVTSIQQLQAETVIVEGHTDSTAGLDYNQALSVRRAESVQQSLIHHGVDAAIIQLKAYGETKPVSSNTTKTGRQRNRRVEVTLH